MTTPWNGWYHITVHTYGAWVRGDPRGWRTLRHRDHVEGDYKNPPALGTFESVYAESLSTMKRQPVKIRGDLLPFVLVSILEKLHSDQIEVAVAALDAKHLHVLAKFPDRKPRHWVGRAKKHSSHIVREQSLRAEQGGLWGRYCYAKPVEDRKHQVSVFRYILAHQHRGAAIWTVMAKENH